jgi:hypothetical protein
MLVRTPHHRPTESLLGYVLRISEANGYDTPWHVVAHAGILRGEMTTAGFPVQKLAAILGRSPDDLNDISYSGLDENEDREFRLLGHTLGKGLNSEPLRLTKPVICPQCIVEHGYIDAFFDLSVGVACPFHRCQLVASCPCCGESLNWFRPGLLTCKCGASFADVLTKPVSPDLANLMAVIWDKLHGTSLDDLPKGTNLPARQLAGVPLRRLLGKLPDLGGFQIRSHGATSCDSTPIELLDSAAQILANWPNGYHDFLDRTALVNSGSAPTTLWKRYEHFSRMFFSKKNCGTDFSWLHQEFIRYRLETYESALDNRKRSGEDIPARYVTITELARRLKVTPATVRDWSKNGLINLKKAGTPDRPRYIADMEDENLRPPIAAEGSVFGEREAAAYLELPVRVLNRLKVIGHFRVQHWHKLKHGFHQADLDEFRKRLLALSPLVGAGTDETPRTDRVSLAQTQRKYRFHDHERKADFIVAYLSGTITSAYRTGDSLGDIFFEKSAVEAFVSNSRSHAANDSLSQVEAAKEIGCNLLAVPILVKNGYLAGEDGREGQRITRASVAKLGDQYVALGGLAVELQTSSRRLMRLCKSNNIPLMQVACGIDNAVSFIERTYEQTLRRLHQDCPPRRLMGMKCNKVLDAVSSYLAELQKQGAPLPRCGKRPHKREIAGACRIDRGVFYRNKEAIQMIEDYAVEELASHQEGGR